MFANTDNYFESATDQRRTNRRGFEGQSFSETGREGAGGRSVHHSHLPPEGARQPMPHESMPAWMGEAQGYGQHPPALHAGADTGAGHRHYDDHRAGHSQAHGFEHGGEAGPSAASPALAQQSADAVNGGSSLISRNVVVDGKRTSIRLEQAYWDALKVITRREGVSVNELCTRIDRLKLCSSFTASVRVVALKYFWQPEVRRALFPERIYQPQHYPQRPRGGF